MKEFQNTSEQAENFISAIPENETAGKNVTFFVDGNKLMDGEILNGPIELGKPIFMNAGSISKVESISKVNGKYEIKTSRSTYILEISN